MHSHSRMVNVSHAKLCALLVLLCCSVWFSSAEFLENGDEIQFEDFPFLAFSEMSERRAETARDAIQVDDPVRREVLNPAVSSSKSDVAEAKGRREKRQAGNKQYVRGCYFTNWAQYRQGQGKYSPEYYVPGLCTHLMYAFLWMNEDFTVKPYEWNDESTAWSKGQFEKVNDLKKIDPQLKTLLSLGGWTFGGRLFSAMASTATNRKRFIDSLVPYVRKNGFDGFDMDWEYPANAVDKANMVLLVQDLRLAFEADSAASQKPRLLLTAAVSAGEATIKTGYDIPQLAKYFDYVFVMTYDFHGAWEQVTGLNSPLYSRPDESEVFKAWNTDFAARFWAASGMPKEKIIVGIGAYGRGWTLQSTSQTGIGAPTTGPSKPTPNVNDAGYASYYELCQMQKDGASRYWQEQNQVPFLVKGDQWFGYDDEFSVRNKMRWLKREGFGGAFVWTLDFDDFAGTCSSVKYPLISVVKEELAGPFITSTDSLRPSPTGLPTPVVTPVSTSQRSLPFSVTTSPAMVASICSNRPDGFYGNQLDCNQFVLCLKSAVYVLRCPASLWFSDALRYCTNAEISGCHQTTPLASSSTSALTANNPPQANVVMQSASVSLPSNFEAPVYSSPPTTVAGTINSGSFKCTADGFFRDPVACNKFYRCVSGTAYTFACPADLFYNPTTQACDYRYNVSCQ